MLHRLVKMTFQADKVETFKAFFDERKKFILNSDGCHRVRLLQQTKDERVLFTYSIWTSEAHLNAYRSSELFADTWAFTKSLFDDKPQAWSLTCIEDLVRQIED